MNILRRRDPAQIVGAVVSWIAVDVVDLVRGGGRRPVEGAAHEAVHLVIFAQDLANFVKSTNNPKINGKACEISMNKFEFESLISHLKFA